jgi:hypothetical protein
VAFSFSKVFAEAIEAKQTAEQLALKAKRDLERIKIEADQKITAARRKRNRCGCSGRTSRRTSSNCAASRPTSRRLKNGMGSCPGHGSGGVPLIGIGDLKGK